MSNSLTGNNPTSYLGVRPTTPPQMLVMKRVPTTNDVIGYDLGTQWLFYDPSSPADAVQYVLTGKFLGSVQNYATWVPLNQGGDDPTLPNHSVALGTGVPGLNSALTVPTVGMALVSTGANSDPEFGLVTVSGGGTGLADCDPYSVYLGGDTGEGPMQQVTGLGNAGQVLTSQGNGTKPIWSDAGGGGAGGPIATQVFTTNSTYTPTAGTASFVVELVGGGGGGGAITTNIGGAGGAGSGGYCRKFFLRASVPVSTAVVIGTGGASTVAGNNSTFLTMSANGGNQGGSGINGLGGIGGTSTGGDINVQGGAGGSGCAALGVAAAPSGLAGFGGSNLYGSGGLGYPNASTDSNGQPGNLYGGGGSGAVRLTNGSANGGIGADGLCIVTEYGPYGIIPPVSGTTINVIVYDTPGAGTYTPTANMQQCIVECVGGGGGSGAVGNTSFAGRSFTSYGGSAGGYCKKLFSSTDIGVSQSFVVGAAGAGGIISPISKGSDGTSTTFGAFLVAGFGQGSDYDIQGSGGGTPVRTIGGVGTGGTINIQGQGGAFSINSTPGTTAVVAGSGGSSQLGSGGIGGTQGGISLGSSDGTGYGAGGGGQITNDEAILPSKRAGSSGSPGVIIITEYIS